MGKGEDKLGIESPDRATFRNATTDYDVIWHFWFSVVPAALAMIHILGKGSHRSGERGRSCFMPESTGLGEVGLVVGKDRGCGRRDLPRSLIVVAATKGSCGR